MKSIPFVKLTSFGNNFVILDETIKPVLSETGTIQKLRPASGPIRLQSDPVQTDPLLFGRPGMVVVESEGFSGEKAFEVRRVRVFCSLPPLPGKALKHDHSGRSQCTE